MALVARSICLSYDENGGVCYNVLHKKLKKLVKLRNPFSFQDDVRMKIRFNGKKLSYSTKLIGDCEKFHHSKSSTSGLISCGWEVKSSKIISHAIIPKKWNLLKLKVIEVTAAVACTFLVMSSAQAVDALKTCTCLLKECRIELAKCIANPSCAANIACLQTCNNRPDETECQIKCGDLFENKVVDELNECAVSRKKCVPQKSDVGDFPVPDPGVLVQRFNMSDFNGKWYITSGLNPTFDTFDCQILMERWKLGGNLEDGKLVGNNPITSVSLLYIVIS